MTTTILFIETTTRLPNGTIIQSTECHRTGERDERGGVLVSFSPDFAPARAEEIAAELGGELVDYDSFTKDEE